jgi:2,3-bisphosphoglycerate-dependent phosphoglycerate mutase
MTDLQCPARVFIARHGQTEYESPVMVSQGGSLTTLGRAQARELGEKLRGERIAHVYCSTLSRAVQTAELAAGVLGVEVTVREGLGEFAVGDAFGKPAGTRIFVEEMQRWVAGDVDAVYPGSESAVDVVARVRPVLDAIADAHRGEAVLVVAHGGVVVATQAVLDHRPGRPWDFPNCAYVELEGDASGWRVVLG